MSCDGRCCAVFMFPSSPSELRARWEGVAEPARPQHRHDDLYIAEMLRPLTVEEAEARLEEFNIEPIDTKKPLYTCRHWDGESRLCLAYDERPMMCQDYPYDKECQHGCGQKSLPHIVTKWLAFRVQSVVRNG